MYHIITISEKYNIIMTIVWQNIEGEGRTWKNIFKVKLMIYILRPSLIDDATQSLTLIEFLIKNGSERVIESCRDKMYKIRALQDYNFYEASTDRGSGVREKSKQIVELLSSNDMIRQEREKARSLRNKFVGISNEGGGGFGGGGYGGNFSNSNDSGSYGGSGRDPYSNRDGRYGDSYDSSSSTRKEPENNYLTRFGGGAYDSSRPTRYADEPEPSKYESHESSYTPAPAPAPAPKIKAPSHEKTSTGGKLKVSIKKTASAAPVSHQPAVDLIEDDFISAAPTNPPVKSQDLFDPFAPAPVPPAANPSVDPFANSFSSPTQTAFDPFQSAPAPAPSQPFNAFATFPPAAPQAFPSAPAAPVYGGYPSAVNAYPPAANAYTPAMNAFPPVQPSAPMYAQTPQFQTQQPTMISPNRPAMPTYENDFGEFESSPVPPAATNLDKWSGVSKLVDLSSIAANDDPKKNVSSVGLPAYGQNAFAGLDGFSKTPQSMVCTYHDFCLLVDF